MKKLRQRFEEILWDAGVGFPGDFREHAATEVYKAEEAAITRKWKRLITMLLKAVKESGMEQVCPTYGSACPMSVCNHQKKESL